MSIILKHARHFPDSAISALRAALTREFSALHQQQTRLFRLALDEAEALAWDSGFPELFFPMLAHEKVSGVALWHERQKVVRQQSPILSFAE